MKHITALSACRSKLVFEEQECMQYPSSACSIALCSSPGVDGLMKSCASSEKLMVRKSDAYMHTILSVLWAAFALHLGFLQLQMKSHLQMQLHAGFWNCPAGRLQSIADAGSE